MILVGAHASQEQVNAELLIALRADLSKAKRDHPRGHHQIGDAFSALFRAAARMGQPLDQLRTHSANEVERFFAHTIAGPDGHVYWNGPANFRRNDGRSRKPRRWWWQHRYGSLDQELDVVMGCGESSCINPEHGEAARTRGSKRYWTDERICGAIQVLALRLGRSPTSVDWDKSGLEPTESLIRLRFGGWPAAVRAAGLEPSRGLKVICTRDDLKSAIRFARQQLGHWPSEREFRAMRVELRANGHPSSIQPHRRLYGSFALARQAAGGPLEIESGPLSRTRRR